MRNFITVESLVSHTFPISLPIFPSIHVRNPLLELTPVFLFIHSLSQFNITLISAFYATHASRALHTHDKLPTSRNYQSLTYLGDRLFGIVVITSDCHTRGPVFDSGLYPRNFSGSIGSGTGSTQTREENWVAT